MAEAPLTARLRELEMLARELRAAKAIQNSSHELVVESVRRLVHELEDFQDTVTGPQFELALRSFIGEVLDLEAIVGVMHARRPVTELETLAQELVRRHDPDVGRIETFLARSPRGLDHPSIIFGLSGVEVTLAILTPDAPVDPPERRGLIAHEVAHLEKDVQAKLWSMRPNVPRRGEVLADLFALSTTGPAFASALATYARGKVPGGSRSHPPLTLRFVIARESLERVWENRAVREWIGSLLSEEVVGLGAVAAPWAADLDASRADMGTVLERLRSLKAEEQEILSLRGLNSPSGIAGALRRAIASCPG